MDTIPPGLLNGVGVVAVVLFVGWLIWTGRLIPRRNHDEIIAGLREQNATLRETNRHLAEQNGVLLDAGIPALTDFMNGLRRAAGDST